MSAIEVGAVVVETMPNGQRVEHKVVALNQPPSNPRAPEGPYVRMTDPMRGRPLLIREQDIHEAAWLTVKAAEARPVPAGARETDPADKPKEDS